MKNIKILPCPFCGGKGSLRYGGIGESFVRCEKCGAIGKKFEINRKYSSDEKAIEAWNSRTNDK